MRAPRPQTVFRSLTGPVDNTSKPAPRPLFPVTVESTSRTSRPRGPFAYRPPYDPLPMAVRRANLTPGAHTPAVPLRLVATSAAGRRPPRAEIGTGSGE